MKKILSLILLGLFVLAACAPAYTEGQVISWDQVGELLHSGQVTMVVQLHSMEVQLTLRSGVTVKTTEPTIDAIFEEIQACGAPCANIALAME